MSNFSRLFMLAACIFASASALFAQTPPNLTWVKEFDAPGTEFVNKIVVDVDGNVYATGYYQGTVNFETTLPGFTRTAAGSNDAFVAKYNTYGVCQWVRTFGNTGIEAGHDIVLANGNVIVVGDFTSSTVIIDTPGVYGVSNSGLRDIFMAAFTQFNGSYIWSTKIGGAGEDIATSLETDGSGNLFLAGLFYGTTDFNPSNTGTNNLSSTTSTYDGFLGKYSASNGAYNWAHTIGGNDVDVAYGLAINNGDVVVTGKFRQNVDFDPTSSVYYVAATGYEDAYVATYNTSGALRSVFTIGGAVNTDVVVGSKLAVSSNGDIYLAGIHKGFVDYDPSTSNRVMDTSFTYDIFLGKYDMNGTLGWVRTFRSIGPSANADEAVNEMILDNNGNILIAGLLYETVNFGYPTNNHITSIFGSDIFLSKYTPAGNNEWAFRLGNTNDGANGIGVDADDNIYLGGYFASGTFIDFNPGSGITNIRSTNANPDLFIAKFSESSGGCTDTYATMVINQACEEFTSPSGIYTYYTSGVYHDTITNNGGCDSIITINVTIKYNSYTDIYPTFCAGDTYTAPDGAQYTSPGIYNATIAASNGCDSVITIELVEALVDANVMVAANGLVTTTTRPATFQWIDCGNNNTPIQGETGSGYAPTVTGSYGVNVTQNGCTEFSGCYSFNVACAETYGTLTTSTCGNFVSPSGNYTWQTAGTYEDTIENAAGCDSIITIILTLGSLDVNVSQGDDYVIVAATDASYQWVDCDNGNAPIAGATGRSYTPAGNGNYAVIVNQATCSDTSACFTFVGVGIREVQNTVGISVYPNPTNNVLHVELTQPEAIEVYNMLGALLARYEASQTHSIDVADYAQGVYLVKAGNSIKRFVKE